MECTMGGLDDAIGTISKRDTDILAEYYKLTLKGELTDEDAAQLEAIYTKAEASPRLNFLINEIDYIVNQKLGLLDVSSVETYKDQQAWLREHLEQMPLDYKYREEMQKLLSEEGFYKGPIDGILGKRSTEAIDNYNRKVQELLHEYGLFEKDADGVLDEYSIEAVKRFQRGNALKEDGVPGRETFTALVKNHYGTNL
jgi:Putative peptidoglycan binding domain